MAKFKFKSFMNDVTGASSRHNKALRDISEWLETVLKFINGYDLYGGPGLETLLGKSGDAKFDLTGLVYNGRPLVKQAEDIMDKDAAAPMQQIVTSLESIRRYLIDPAIQEQRLQEAVDNLLTYYEKLLDTLKQTELK